MRIEARMTVLVVLGALPARAQDLADLVDPGATAAKVAGGYRLADGPAWSPKGFLVFTDLEGDRIVRLDPDGATRGFLSPSRGARGLSFDGAGNLYFCPADERGIVRVAGDGSTIMLRTGRHGRKVLGYPHDIALDPHGGAYIVAADESAALEQPRRVYYLDRAGELSLAIEDPDELEALGVSPDGRHLYAAVPGRKAVDRYEIAAPGRPAGRHVVYTGEGSGPRDLAHDVHGNVYAVYDGVVVLDPRGRLIGRIPVAEEPLGCAFGGADRKTLYVASRTGVYAVKMRVSGMALREPTDARRDVKVGALALKVPVHWIEREPGASKRFSQFRIRKEWSRARKRAKLYLQVPAEKGDRAPAELVVYHYGARGAGSDEKVAGDWTDQFAKKRPPDVLEDARVEVVEGEGYTLVDAVGTGYWNQGPAFRVEVVFMPGLRMLAAILPTEDGPYYVKLTGPERTVNAAERDFRSLLDDHAGGSRTRR